MNLADEIAQYPLTGRFLLGRLRYDLFEEEKSQLERLVREVRRLEHNETLIPHGQVCNASTILIDGFMMRTIEKHDRRYAVSFHVPGDFVDLHCFALKKLDHSVQSIGSTTIGQVTHDEIYNIMENSPHLARVLWFQTLLDAALHRQKIVKLEQLTVPGRIAHLFAETWHRLEMVGLAFADGFKTPFTQSDIADLCGTTSIHANRAIVDLRKRGIADFQRGAVRINDRRQLEEFADFDAEYLYSDGTISLRPSKGDGAQLTLAGKRTES